MCLKENWNIPEDGAWNCWLLDVKPDTKTYTINSYTDLERFATKFPHEEKLVPIDFEAASKRYDAIHLTGRGQQETHLSHPLSLYGWDCESTLWFR